MKREKVMQQALETLERKYESHRDWLVAYTEAITALRAALAEPEPQPVAWRHWLHLEGERFPQLTLVPRAEDDEPLYTHPARVPLTEDEIFALVQPQWDCVRNARAIERAHGIGEKE